MAKLVFPELSYKIIGCVFATYNQLGFGYQEKYYYRLLKQELQNQGLSVKEQLYTPLKISDRIIGSYYLDFLINETIVLELKIANRVYPKHIKQVLGYLKAHNLRLGIIVVFTKDGVLSKRILN